MSLESHPDSCDLSSLSTYAKTRERPLAVDLFCGAGGLSLGLQEAGFDVVLGVDTFSQAVETHRAFFGGASVVGDLSDPATVANLCRALEGVEISLVAGGPPCQPFSRAGRSKIRSLVAKGERLTDNRKELWRSFVDVVAGVQPDAVLVENVPDFALGHESIAFRRLVVALEAEGYAIHSRILPTWRFGVPQHRQRLIVVGVRDGVPFRWPRPTRATSRSLRDAISDLPRVTAGSRKDPLRYSGPQTSFQRSLRRSVSGEAKGRIRDHIARPIRADDLEAFKHLKHGTLYSDLPERLRRYRSDIFEDKYHRLHWDKPCRTITAHLAHDGYWYIHPAQHRSLTIREAARVQTFPDRIRFAGHPSHAYRQIGEAVPPLLARLVGKALLRAMESRQCAPAPPSSTSAVSRSLSEWFSALPEHELVAPWRRSGSIWLALLGFVVLGRSAPAIRQEQWLKLRERWPDPRSFEVDRGRNTFLRTLGRDRSATILRELAAVLTADGDLTNNGSRSPVRGLSQDRLELARAVLGRGDNRPVTAGVTRTIERIRGVSSEDSKMHAQLLLSLVIGPDPTGSAYAGLLELSDSVCLPTSPRCDLCLLADSCRRHSLPSTRAP